MKSINILIVFLLLMIIAGLVSVDKNVENLKTPVYITIDDACEFHVGERTEPRLRGRLIPSPPDDSTF